MASTSCSLTEGELSDADVRCKAQHIRVKMLETPVLRPQGAATTKEQCARGAFRNAMMSAVVTGMGTYQSVGKQFLSNERVRAGVASVVPDIVYEALLATDTRLST